MFQVTFMTILKQKNQYIRLLVRFTSSLQLTELNMHAVSVYTKLCVEVLYWESDGGIIDVIRIQPLGTFKMW